MLLLYTNGFQTNRNLLILFRVLLIVSLSQDARARWNSAMSWNMRYVNCENHSLAKYIRGGNKSSECNTAWSQPQINSASIVSPCTLTNRWPIKVAINFLARALIFPRRVFNCDVNSFALIVGCDRGARNEFACTE